MTPRRYLQVDVFADRPGAGNALGVVLDAEGLDDAAMQAIAGWLQLSETVFFLPVSAKGADYRIRIFTPCSELPFAGHPSVGAAWAALETGLVPDTGALVQECGAGLLPVQVARQGAARRIRLRAPQASPVTVDDAQAFLADAVSIALPLGTLPPALWQNGPGWWLVELRDADCVRSLTPDLGAIAALTRETAAVGLAVFGRAGHGQDHDLVVRAFCPADNIPEDPVTGSANACIAAALHAADRLPGHAGRYIVSQGRELGRDGRIEVQVDAEGQVWIGGQVQPVIQGSLAW
jgi:PhzF family phenazine biosynthesis protein